MSATVHVSTTPPLASSSPAPRTALPWQPSQPADVPTSASNAGPDAWASTIARTPYLSKTQFSDFSIVYMPPTVIQLSEATGCSVSDLAGAYNDLPVIRLSREVSSDATAPPLATAETQLSDPCDYLQLVPIDETLELATNAVRVRRPVPDAEETFWEADYWEKLKRIKQEQQQRKDQRRKGNKMAQTERKELKGTNINTAGQPSAYTLGNTTFSTSNSPCFMTPHSRQGSLNGHAVEGDTSPPMATLQSSQRQKKIAKGFLRRARYNESHNPSHMQSRTTRSASLLSQSSTSGLLQPQQQVVVRCRSRPRSYSMNSQQADARGFQYSISSAMSEGGRSALSDSLRTPPLLFFNGAPQSREALAPSLEMELSISGGVTKSGATTHSCNSAVTYGCDATPRVPSPHEESVPSQRRSRVRNRQGSVANGSPSTPLSSDSKRSLPLVKKSEGLAQTRLLVNGAAPAPAQNNPTGPQQVGAAALQVQTTLTNTASSPAPTGVVLERVVLNQTLGSPSRPLATPEAPNNTVAAVTTTTTAFTTVADNGAQPLPTSANEESNDVAPAAPAQRLPTSNSQKTPTVLTTEGNKIEAVVQTGPSSRITTARPSSALRPQHTGATVSCLSGAEGPSRALKTAPLITMPAHKDNISFPVVPRPSSPVSGAESSNTLTTTATISSTRNKNLGGHSAVVMDRKLHRLHMPFTEDLAVESTNSGKGVKHDALASSKPATAEAFSPETTPTMPPLYLERSGSPTANHPVRSTSTQGLSAPDNSAAKTTTLTTTSLSSATPRATATTVSPSRTPTREASFSPQFDRIIAVHSTSPTDLQQGTSQEVVAVAASMPTLMATQPPRAPTCALSHEGSNTTNSPRHIAEGAETITAIVATALTAAPSPHPPSAGDSPPPTPLKENVQCAKPVKNNERENRIGAATTTPPGTRRKPPQVTSSAAPQGTTEPATTYGTNGKSAAVFKAGNRLLTATSSASPSATASIKPIESASQSPTKTTNMKHGAAPPKTKQAKTSDAACCTVM